MSAAGSRWWGGRYRRDFDPPESAVHVLQGVAEASAAELIVARIRIAKIHVEFDAAGSDASVHAIEPALRIVERTNA